MPTSNHLIFLITQPRARSTLQQRILAGDSRIHTASEPCIVIRPHGFSVRYRHSQAREAANYFLTQLSARGLSDFDAAPLLLNHLYEHAISTTFLYLPLHPQLADADFDRILTALRAIPGEYF